MQFLKFKFILFLILNYTFTHSQIPGPTTNWYFGNGAGITFNSGMPVALTNGALTTTEGVATISDNSGNLLFYTNGVTVYNRNHIIMVNGSGLSGNISSTQSSIIVKQPGNINIYYIFTSDNDAEIDGIRYSIVDMNLDGGNGAVTLKNILLQTPSCEKLCAVRHCNNEDIWVISHDWNSNTFRCWLVDDIGVGSITSWSNTGYSPSGISQAAYGQLKASSDGKKLAACYYGFAGNGGNRVQLYDFDNSTGFVSNAQTLSTDVGLYGCEFSPNNNVLYAATNQGLLIQFDLCSSNIPLSRTVISNAGPFIGSLQLGPNNKIYVTRNSSFLSVINNPDIVGLGCGYVNASFSLLNRNSTFGLPNFASFYSQPTFNFPNPNINCNVVNFLSPLLINQGCSIPIGNYIFLWDFGDGNTSTISSPIHTYLSSGTYNITLNLIGNCSTITLQKTITITNGVNVSIYTN
jgi:hypothetical protein